MVAFLQEQFSNPQVHFHLEGGTVDPALEGKIWDVMKRELFSLLPTLHWDSTKSFCTGSELLLSF